MKNRLTTLLIVLFLNPLAFSHDWTIKDAIDIAAANIQQIQDIQMTFREQRFDEDKNKSIVTQFSFVPGSKWQKQITTKTKENGEKIITCFSWDGDKHKTLVQAIDSHGKQERKEGTILGKYEKLRPTPFDVIGFMSAKKSLVDHLSSEDATIEGNVLCDGKETLVIADHKPTNDRPYMRYYLDMARGAVPLKQEFVVSGKVVRTVTNITISEIKPGLFLPTKCDIFSVEINEGKSKWLGFDIDVSSIKLNQRLTQKDFDIEFAHNLPVWDRNIGMGYYEGVGAEPEQPIDKQHFEQLIEDTKSLHIDKDTVAQDTDTMQRVELAAHIDTNRAQQEQSMPQSRQNHKNNEVAIGKTHTENFLWLTIGAVALALMVIGGLIISRKN